MSFPDCQGIQGTKMFKNSWASKNMFGGDESESHLVVSNSLRSYGL